MEDLTVEIFKKSAEAPYQHKVDGNYVAYLGFLTDELTTYVARQTSLKVLLHHDLDDDGLFDQAVSAFALTAMVRFSCALHTTFYYGISTALEVLKSFRQSGFEPPKSLIEAIRQATELTLTNGQLTDEEHDKLRLECGKAATEYFRVKEEHFMRDFESQLKALADTDDISVEFSVPQMVCKDTGKVNSLEQELQNLVGKTGCPSKEIEQQVETIVNALKNFDVSPDHSN